jgi:hypothetical protein
MRDPAYQIDPSRDQIMINVTDLRSTIFPAPPTASASSVNIRLTSINVYKLDGGTLSMVRTFNTPYIDGNSTITVPPVVVKNNISLIINPRVFDIMQAGYSQVYFNLTFTVNPASTFLNNTNARSQPFDYNYFSQNVTQPKLRDAVVEVSVW